MPNALEEKDAIRELLAEYCFRLDDGRFTEMAALFAEDGTWDTAFGKATGRSGIADLARNLRERPGAQRSRGIHLVTNVAIALDGTSARVRSNWAVVQNSPEGPKIGSAGAYHDELVKDGGQWLFNYRKIDRVASGSVLPTNQSTGARAIPRRRSESWLAGAGPVSRTLERTGMGSATAAAG